MRRSTRAPVRAVHEDGFSLIEALVSMVIFAVVASVAVTLILQSVAVARTDTQRVTADNLANQQIESTRNQRALDIPNGTVVLPAASTTEDGTVYTVTQTVSFVSTNSSASLCNSNGPIASKLITVVVTWPNMGSVQPVRVDTLRALGIGKDNLDASKGNLALLVQNNASTPVPQPGIAVTLNPGGLVQTTGSDGCAIYTGLDPTQTYTATANQAGYVGVDGTQSASVSNIGVQAGAVTRQSLGYAQPGTLSATLSAPSGTQIPSGLSYSMNTSGWSPTQTRQFAACAGSNTFQCITTAGTTVTAANLFPASYQIWAGTCNDAKPSTIPSATVTSGATTSASPSLSLTGATVTLSGSGFTIQSIAATHAADASAGCQNGERYTLPSPGNGGGIAFPAGTWVVSVTYTKNGQTYTQSSASQVFTAGQTTRLTGNA